MTEEDGPFPAGGDVRPRNRPACISGVGNTPLGKSLGCSAWVLQARAVKAAVADAGLEIEQVDGFITEAGYSQGVIEGIVPHFLRLGGMLGLDPAYTYSEVLGGASCVAMVERAAMAIEAGLCRACVCVFGDAPSRAAGTWDYGRGEQSAFGLFGAVGLHALAARRHMAVFGTREEDLGEIAVTFREHASRNPAAQERRPLKIGDYLASRFVVEPLRVLDCCLVSDGAGAVVVSSFDLARDGAHPPIEIAGFGQAHCLGGLRDDHYLEKLPASRAAATAFAMAGVGPAEIDVAQFYDCFTIAVLMQLEGYGFCAPGEAGRFVAEGNLRLSGSLPSNTAGGLLSEGFGGGMFHIIEAVRQLRGECGERQVRGAEHALVTGHGLGMNTHSALVLRKG